jgi:hypothetical protein
VHFPSSLARMISESLKIVDRFDDMREVCDPRIETLILLEIPDFDFVPGIVGGRASADGEARKWVATPFAMPLTKQQQ